MAREYQITVQDRRGKYTDVIEVVQAKQAWRLFNVACKCGTPFPPRGRGVGHHKTVKLFSGNLARASTYGTGIEPEQAGAVFKRGKLIASCQTK